MGIDLVHEAASQKGRSGALAEQIRAGRNRAAVDDLWPVTSIILNTEAGLGGRIGPTALQACQPSSARSAQASA
jgi:hypothetical protein